MNFRQIEAFRAVMVTGSASRAADLLQISQPAISRSILELEKTTGFALFDRVRGRLVPTAEGQLFFRDVESTFQGLDRLRISAARIRDFGTGDIRIASLAAMGSTLVPHALRLFREKHPSIAVTLQVASSATVRELVVSSRFDVGLAADEIDVAGLEHQLFATPKVSVRQSHLEIDPVSRHRVHDEHHAHYGERHDRPAPQAALLLPGT